MYKSYLDTHLGLLEITCDDDFLISIFIVDKKEQFVENNISIEVSKQLQEYFNHERESFDVPINFDDSFSQRVRKCLYESEYSTTMSYKELGEKVGSRAYQAIGSCMANNPYFIVVP